MSITTTNPCYAMAKPRWEKNRDFCSGEMAVKAKGRKYLPDDNEAYDATGHPTGESIRDDKDPFKYERKYQNYLRRASLLTIAQHTRNGMVGLVFNEDPITGLPDSLAFISENADGSGQSLEQLAKYSVSESLEVGRVGLLVDMPNVDGVRSLQEEREANLRARILTYDAESIVDWAEETKGSLTYLSFVKLRECYYDRDDLLDDYGTEKIRYRILRLTDEGYSHQVVEEDGTSPQEPVLVKMSGGNSFSYIPFFFIGAENNKPDIDDAPLSGIVDINASHYINSADNEQLNHLYSLPMPHLDVGASETSETFAKNNPRGLEAGSGALTQGGGTFAIHQIEANSSLANLIERKEEQAEKIGARFAGEGNSQNVTAEAARINAAFTTSTLTTVVSNVSEGIESALQAVADFMGADRNAVSYELSKSFYGKSVDYDAARFLMDLYDRGDMLTEERLYAEMSKLGIELDEISRNA